MTKLLMWKSLAATEKQELILTTDALEADGAHDEVVEVDVALIVSVSHDQGVKRRVTYTVAWQHNQQFSQGGQATQNPYRRTYQYKGHKLDLQPDNAAQRETQLRF